MEKTKLKEIPLELKSVSNFSFGWRVLVWVALLCGGAYLALGHSTIMIIAGVLLLGIGIAHGVELSHQALHNTGFTSRKSNEIVGLFMGLPLLVSFYEYRISHLSHHKNVGTQDDTEYFDYGDGPLSIASFFGILSMWRHYARFLANFARFLMGKPIPGFRQKNQPMLKIFYITFIAFVTALITAGVLLENVMQPLLIWVCAVVFVAGPVHALIEFPEHYQCDNETKNTLMNTRSIKSNWFMTWFTNGNNFHVEHHMHPIVPLQNARMVHDILHPDHGHYNSGYRAFYLTVFSNRVTRRFSNMKSQAGSL